VAVGDISVRFPNLIEPWTKHVYARLDDKNDHVRKNALMVLTHLILNDMVKAKGPVVAIAKCLRDPTEAVANLAGLFFQELSRKGENPVYNVLPDVISRLSTDAAVTQDAFRYVLKFLLQYVNKDRQVDGLVDKLCHRFHAVHVDTKQMQAAAKKSKQEEGEGEQKQQQEQEQQKKKESSSSSSADDAIVQCRNMAYCLSELNLTQNAFSKFMSLYPLYANKLGDEVVFEYLQLVLAKGKKVAKADAKSNVEEFEQKLQEGHDKQIDDIYADTHAKGAKRVKVDSADVLEEIARLKLQNEEQARERKEAKMTKGRRGRKKAPTAAVAMPTPAQEGAKAATVTKAKPAPKRRAPVRRKPRKKVVESSSESESSSSESSESSQYESD
jgi:condensin complex subunit 1